jgi:hypothetical protein
MYDYNKPDEFFLRSEQVIKENNADQAFLIITSEIDQSDDLYLNEYIAPLNYLRHSKTHDWIEGCASRITNVSSNWGHLAASSYFTWDRADKWLTKGRPLSLIALDALIFCTTRGERLNQSLWMRENRPTLIDNPKLDVVAKRLHEYLNIDKVPRTRVAIEKIINNIFDV